MEAVRAAGRRAAAIQADLTDPAAPRALFDAAEAAFGGTDILVNNAGTMQLSQLGECDDAMLDAHVALNLAAPVRLMREAALRLPESGRIVSLSSSVVGLYQSGYGLYAATKAGIEALTHVLAKELGPKGVTVNAVAPGPVGTDFFLRGKSDALVAQISDCLRKHDHRGTSPVKTCLEYRMTVSDRSCRSGKLGGQEVVEFVP